MLNIDGFIRRFKLSQLSDVKLSDIEKELVEKLIELFDFEYPISYLNYDDEFCLVSNRKGVNILLYSKSQTDLCKFCYISQDIFMEILKIVQTPDNRRTDTQLTFNIIDKWFEYLEILHLYEVTGYKKF